MQNKRVQIMVVSQKGEMEHAREFFSYHFNPQKITSIKNDFQDLCNNLSRTTRLAVLWAFYSMNETDREVLSFWDNSDGYQENRNPSLYQNKEWNEMKKLYYTLPNFSFEKQQTILENMYKIVGTRDLTSVDPELRLAQHYWDPIYTLK